MVNTAYDTTTNATTGLRKFLNGNSYDYTNGYVGTYSVAAVATGDSNTYEVTFFDAFSPEFRDAVLVTEVPCRANIHADSPYDGEEYIAKDKVFIPSQVELNSATGNNHSSEVVWSYFSGATDTNRIAIGVDGNAQSYWTRSPLLSASSSIGIVRFDGSSVYTSSYSNRNDVRPALTLKSDIPVSGIPNTFTSASEITPKSDKTITISDGFGFAGETIQIDITASNISMAGFQLAINYDPEVLFWDLRGI